MRRLGWLLALSGPAAAEATLHTGVLHVSDGDGEGNTNHEWGGLLVVSGESPRLGGLAITAAVGWGSFRGADAWSNAEIGSTWRYQGDEVALTFGLFLDVPFATDEPVDARALEARRYVAASSGRWNAWRWSPQTTVGGSAQVVYATADLRLVGELGLAHSGATDVELQSPKPALADGDATYVQVAASVAKPVGCGWLEGRLVAVPDFALGDTAVVDSGYYDFGALDGSPVSVAVSYGGPLSSDTWHLRGGALLGDGLFPFLDLESRW